METRAGGGAAMMLDTSCIIEWAKEARDWPWVAEHLVDEEPITGWMQLAEGTRWLRLEGHDEVTLGPLFHPWLRVEAPTVEDFVNGGELAAAVLRQDGVRMSLADGVICSQAKRLGHQLLSLDADFAGLDGVVVLDRTSRGEGRPGAS